MTHQARPRDSAPHDPVQHVELGPSQGAVGEEDHDVLIFPRAGVVRDWECYRVPVVKSDANAPERRRGEYLDAPERWDLHAFGQRRAVSIARPHHGTADPPRGPAFAVLPIKPEPAATSVGTCYLINAESLASPNLWTVEEWNDDPLGKDFLAPEHPSEFEVLIAGPWGQVFRVKIQHRDEWPGKPLPIGSGKDTIGEVERIDLSRETETWTQLRNGCVAGRVWFEAGGRVVPLVNVTALSPLPLQTAIPASDDQESRR